MSVARCLSNALDGDGRAKLPSFRNDDLLEQLQTKIEELKKGLRSASGGRGPPLHEAAARDESVSKRPSSDPARS